MDTDEVQPESIFGYQIFLNARLGPIHGDIVCNPIEPW
jgi:hypothetical protein